MDDETQQAFSKIADDKKMEGVADTLDGCAAVHRDISSLEK